MPDPLNPAGDTAANPGSTGTGSPSGTSTAQPPSSSTPQPGSPGAAAPGAGSGEAATGAGAGGAGASGTGTPPEDRSNWIPPYRVQEMSRRAATLERQLAIEQARTRALAGLPAEQPRFEDTLSPEDRELRQGFLKLFPEFKVLMEHGDKLAKLAPAADDLLTRGDEQWVREGHRTLRTLSTAYAKHIGAESLEPASQRRLGALFQDWLESDPQLASRYAYGDDRLVDEFIDDLDKSFLSPVRRQGQAGAETTAQQVGSVTRPPAQGQPGARGVQRPDPHAAPPNEDEVHARAFQGMRTALGR